MNGVLAHCCAMEDRHRRSGDPPTAFISWAHESEDWQASVATFASTVRNFGIDADVDLWHQHRSGLDWTTYGIRSIEESEFVLIVASAAYKKRWQSTESRGEGAGVAREANALKALFDEDQQAFRHKVKVILLAPATVDDIPTELRATAQRFEIKTMDEAEFEDLLRTLTNRPAYVRPPVGRLPPLPPKSVGAGPRAGVSYDAVANAIAELPEREKLVMALTYYERLTGEDIAEILGIAPTEVSRLAQTASSRLGATVIADLASDIWPDRGQYTPTAHIALLRDGPRKGERIEIKPGQTAIAITESFDFDQGQANVIDHYFYEEPHERDPDTAVFTFSHQEHRVTTSG